MTAHHIAQTSRADSLLWNWRRTTGQIFRAHPIDYQSSECYRVDSERGTWHLQRHPNGTTEEELQHLNAFFLVMEEGEYHVSSRYIRNDRGDLGSWMVDECWTLSHVTSQGEFKSPWVGSALDSNMLDSAAEVLANIHAYGSVYIQRGNRILSVSPAPPALLTRFARLSPKIYGSEGQATGLEKRRRHPLMLFRSLVPADRTQTTCVTVVNNTGKPEPDIAYHEQKLMDADLAWQPEASHTPLRYAVLMARVRHVLEEIHREETALGKPETIVHGNYGCENLVYDRSRIVRVIGWQGLRLGSPLADLGQAFVMLMTDWSKPSRPHDCNTMADFNKAEAQRFYEHYATVMTRLCGGVMMPLNFPQVLQSGSLIKNYMRLACYRILVEQLESQGMSDYHLNIRCRVITQVLHVERLLWL